MTYFGLNGANSKIEYIVSYIANGLFQCTCEFSMSISNLASIQVPFVDFLRLVIVC